MTQNEKATWLNRLLGDELISHLQYKIAAHNVIGPDYDACQAEFTEHADEEYEHMGILMDKLVEEHLPIDQGLIHLINNSYSGYDKQVGRSSAQLLAHHHQAEVNAIRAYKQFLHALGCEDPGLRDKIKEILNDELKHRTDLEKLESSVNGRTDNLVNSQELFSRKSDLSRKPDLRTRYLTALSRG